MNKQDLEDIKKDIAIGEVAEHRFNDRVEYIFDLIKKFFYSEEPETFWWSDAPEGEMGRIPNSIFIYEEDIAYEVDSRSPKLDTKDWDFNDSFPFEFLFMSDKEINDQLGTYEN